MLKITEEAASLIRSLTRGGSIPATGGLRIVVNPATQSLSMGPAAAPERADAVIRRDGALLFVSGPAAECLSEQTLCADIAGARSTFFLVH